MSGHGSMSAAVVTNFVSPAPFSENEKIIFTLSVAVNRGSARERLALQHDDTLTISGA